MQSSFLVIATHRLWHYVKNNSNLSLDVHHFTGHCKMAPLDAGGVVDGNTRVYGTKNVFVADDSICPVIPDINTAGSAMMIGLRSSEILKQCLANEKMRSSMKKNILLLLLSLLFFMAADELRML